MVDAAHMGTQAAKGKAHSLPGNEDCARPSVTEQPGEKAVLIQHHTQL